MRTRAQILLALAGAVTGAAIAAAHAQAQAREHSYAPAPPAVADYFPEAYPGAAILPSARVDTTRGTATLPLHRGRMRDGRAVWYVLTDASERRFARRHGLNWSPKLRAAPAAATRASRMLGDGTLEFARGTVDFRPERRVVPGAAPDFFPPAVAAPGAAGDADYSPLARVTNRGGLVLNASVVAFGEAASAIEFPDGDVDHTRVTDRAVAISPARGTVTLAASLGTSSDRPILFVSLDSNDPLLSALEATTVAPALRHLPTGRDDAPDSAVAANYIIANGPTGADSPQRQGLQSALGDPGAQVLDIFDGAPGVLNGRRYSPMWDLYVSSWTPAAIERGLRARIGSELELLSLARHGAITAPGGGPVASSGLISNCPLLMRF